MVNQELHISIIYNSKNQKQTKYTATEMVKEIILLTYIVPSIKIMILKKSFIYINVHNMLNTKRTQYCLYRMIYTNIGIDIDID